MECLACEVAKRGGTTTVAHTCPESGTWLAAEGHAAGEELDPTLGYYSVSLHFRIRALDEQHAREKLTGLVSELLDDDLVEAADLFVQVEDPVSA